MPKFRWRIPSRSSSTDGTTLSLKAAKEAAALARDLKAKLTAIYVMAPFVPP
jgi:nucleotide-binding universal stress UspA family protein